MRPLARTKKIGIVRIGIVGAILAAMNWLPVAAGDAILATQKNRAFEPGSVELSPGQALRILNDDGPLLHHAYVRSPRFSFDSGEQKPGATVDIVFTELGSYTVLCGIHPKMRLTVTVR